jgi:hypothetical protein
MLVLLLLHVPPDAASVNVIVLPVQTVVGPEMLPGPDKMLMVVTAKQPPGMV